MFETAELDHSVGKEEYAERVPIQREGLLNAQARLRRAGFPVIVLFAGVNGDFTVIEGELIGTTLIAADPSAPPEAYDNPDEDLIAQDLFLDKDNLSVDAGILFVFGRYEISFNYSQTLIGRNQANLQTFSASAAVRLEGVTGR